MNTSMKELNMNDMELASGGGSCLGAAVKKLVSMTGDWIADTAAPPAKMRQRRRAISPRLP